MSLAETADLLACPACAARDVVDAPLRLDGATLRCPGGHAYDVARQGYVNLLGRAVPRNADDAAMVAARERFLGTGAYDPVAAALGDAALRCAAPAPVVLDVGAGPGWYLERVLARFAEAGRTARGLALDVSPAAARRTARTATPGVGAVVADAWERLPVRAGSVDVVVSVFAPRRPAELVRVLAPGGTVVVVSPLPEHLAELRASWGLLDVEAGKQERLAATFGAHLSALDAVDVRYPVALDRSALEDLVAMGPNAFHAGRRDRRTAEPSPRTRVAVQVSRWGRPDGR